MSLDNFGLSLLGAAILAVAIDVFIILILGAAFALDFFDLPQVSAIERP